LSPRLTGESEIDEPQTQVRDRSESAVADAPKVTLQINLAPTDLRHAQAILPHELRQFGDQVDEILLVLDLNKNRFVDGAVWERGAAGLRDLAESLRERYPHLRLVDVDPDAEVAAQVATEFSAGVSIPQKDWRGAPIYAYFFGLWAAKHEYILHMDSDMMFGGGSQTWVREAVDLLRGKPDVLLCSPLPGPPTVDGRLTAQTLTPEPMDSLAFRTEHVSSRVFLLDRSRFGADVRAVDVVPPSRHKVWLARVDGYEPHECAETLLSIALATSGLSRIDFLGTDPGLWSLHPPYRSELFYADLPNLIARIEAGDVPDAQRGNYDVDDSMVDWTSARPPKWRRLLRHGELGARNLLRIGSS
jgi:hypothetical protein